MKQIVLGLSVSLCLGVFVTSCKEPDVESDPGIEKSKITSDAQARLDLPSNMFGIDWHLNNPNNFLYWSGNGIARSGTYNDTDPASTSTYSFVTAGQATTNHYTIEIVEMSIGLEPGTTINRCYTYFHGGIMAEGTSNDLDLYANNVPYVCAAGKFPADIVGIAVNSLNHTYAWYKDGTVSYGTKTNLAQHHAPYGYTLPPGKSFTNIVGMAIARGDSDKVYTWFSDGTVSIGTSSDLDYYSAPVPFD